MQLFHQYTYTARYKWAHRGSDDNIHLSLFHWYRGYGLLLCLHTQLLTLIKILCMLLFLLLFIIIIIILLYRC